MNPQLAGILVGVLAATGVVLLAAWFIHTPVERSSTKRRRRSPSLVARWQNLEPGTRFRVVFGFAVGLVVAIITSLPLLAVIVPLALAGLPLVLAKPSTKERDLLLALETWTRSLAAAAETGAFTLREVVGITRGATPPMIRPNVNRLYARMSSTWSAPEAFRAFADEVNDTTADEILLYLIQASRFDAGGLSRALTGVADVLATKAKLSIEILQERAKPRQAMITMTALVTILIVFLVLLMGGDQMAFYQSSAGTITLIVMVGMFAGLLVWFKAAQRVKPTPRLLASEDVPA